TGPKAVAQKPANKLGLHDMSGNVWEWCWNVQSDNKGFPAVTPTGTDTSIGTEAYRVTRGGSWSNDENSCAVYTQSYTQSSYLGNGIAFRVVCKL
ncbi:MAG: formylglycine-generating enzyme family protein, partial [Dysgonamonadaceae bacterium]|nr:formylglycine-generating enzyme family protein [Dysgonamonadaceae bacterium]